MSDEDGDSSEDEALQCPITHELFREPVIAEDTHTYEKDAIEKWITKHGTSPLTRQPISIEGLRPNRSVKKFVRRFQKFMHKKKYQFTLGIDVIQKTRQPLYEAFLKAIYRAEWAKHNETRPKVILLKLGGTQARREASFYVELGRHPHIVQTFGFVKDKDSTDRHSPVLLLQEYAPQGSLEKVLKAQSKVPDEKVLIQIFLQITEAMKYLAANNIVHGNLACCNVLVFRFDGTNPDNNVVKITDFGLSQQSNLYSITPDNEQPMFSVNPIRYAAPEILPPDKKSKVFTEKSDVYSMGILMWEAYSQGLKPWENIEEDEEVIKQVIGGHVLEKPQVCSGSCWSIILKTWTQSPNDRPSFSELQRRLTEEYDRPGVITDVTTVVIEPGTKNDSVQQKNGRTETRQIFPNLHLSTNTRWEKNGMTIAGNIDYGSGLNRLNHPISLFVDVNQNVYVADRENHRIIRFQSGNPYGVVVAGGKGPGDRLDQLNKPSSVIVDEEKACMYICDHENKRVMCWPLQNSTSGQIIIRNIKCVGLTTDNQGFLYVSEIENHSVQKWRVGDEKGEVIAGGLGKGPRDDQLDHPVHLFVDHNQTLYVSDLKNKRVMKWEKNATKGICVAGNGSGGDDLRQLVAPAGLFVDRSGILYVADYWMHQITRWPQEVTKGTVIAGGKGSGRGAKDLNRPDGLAFDQEGNLYVADCGNNRVQKYCVLPGDSASQVCSLC